MTTLTERVDRAAEDVLKGGTKDRELNEAEQRLFEELARRIRGGDLSADGELWRLDYARTPPDLRTFIMDDYYLGRTLRPIPGENEGIWPMWLAFLIRDFDLGSYIHNAVVTGSLGTGKTLVSVVLLLYRVCIATCLKNPQHFFGISRGSRIVYNFLSVTKEAVKDTAFGDAMNMMGSSPYFTEVCGYNPDSDYSGFRIPLSNQLFDGRDSNIWITAGSKGQHLIGRNVVGVVLDEGNFRLEKDPDLKAYALYDAVRTRIANRFQKLSTFLPALCLIASSAADESSFTEKVVTEIENQERRRQEENAKRPDGQQVPQTQLIYRNAVYQIKRHLLQDIGPDHHWFKVAHGLKNMEPYILEGWYHEDGTPIGDGPHEDAPNGAKTELVPKFYWDAFRRNCRTNLQSLSGISTGGAHRLFASTIDIEWCLAQSEVEGLRNPVIPGVERMAISNEDTRNVWDFLVHPHFVTRSASRHLPLRQPDRLRYAHIDLATQNLCGVAICHLVGAQLVEGLVKDGLPFSEYRLVIEYDFILTICAGATKPISIDKIQRFFFWLRDMCGFSFGLVTADMFQSTSMLQMMEAKGFKTDLLSIDKNKAAYTSWRTGFEERRIRLPRNAQMMREAESLLEMDKKFDHPPEGCFTGETEVRLLNGTSLTLQTMAEKGGTFWVYGNDGTGKIIPVEAYDVRKTKTVDSVLEIVLDNGKSVRCTPDHRFMLRDGSYLRADQLEPETALMPLYTNLYTIKYKRGKGVYEQVFSNGNWRMTHATVADHFGAVAVKGETVIHHIDCDPRNNDPSNLAHLTVSAHNAHHASIARTLRRPEVIAKRVASFKRNYAANPDRRIARRLLGKATYSAMSHEQKVRFHSQTPERQAASKKRLLEYNATPERQAASKKRLAAYARSDHGRKLSSLTASKTNCNPRWWSEKRKTKHRLNVAKASREGWKRHSAKLIQKLGPRLPYILGPYHAIKLTKTGSSWAWKNRLKKAGVNFAENAERLRGMPLARMLEITGLSANSLSEFLRKLGKYEIMKFNNHVVRCVNVVQGSFDVYDLSIKGPHENFALMAGISVHNSKDSTDAAAGAYFNAINSEEKNVLASHNAPTVTTGRIIAEQQKPGPIVEIPIPDRGYVRTKQFSA